MERESGTASAPGSLYVDLDRPKQHSFAFAAQPSQQAVPKAKSKKKRKKDKR